MPTKAAHILKKLRKNTIIIALEERDNMFSSEHFATILLQWRQDGITNMVFVVGNTFGLDARIVNKARFTLKSCKNDISPSIGARVAMRTTVLCRNNFSWTSLSQGITRRDSMAV